MSELEKAQKVYQEILVKYYEAKDDYEDYFYNPNSKFNVEDKQYIVRNFEAYEDQLNQLVKIFGDKVRG